MSKSDWPGLVKKIEKAIKFEPCTDLANAERFANAVSDVLGVWVHYVPLVKAWFLWDGKRWHVDELGEVWRFAADVAREIYFEAGKTDDKNEAERIAAWARTSQNETRLRAMLSLAEKLPGIALPYRDLDADPWLLGTPTGTVDLRSGTLREAARADLITKQTGAMYLPDARLELWERFLDEVTDGDTDLQGFLQRAVGYSLTGLTTEEKFFFVHGPGASGKSTFLEAVKAALGDYSMTADFEAFLKRSQVGGPRNDIARLGGARFVASIEVDEGKELAGGLVKMLTGGDTVTARFLYHESFEFMPRFKLWLSANHAPKVNDQDEAMWRRILRVPFVHVVPKGRRDPAVKAALKDPTQGGPAILAWAVQGCLAWQREGLGVPAVVEKSTEELRREMDPLGDFLRDCCKLSPSLSCYAGVLRTAYEKWAKERGEGALVSSREWSQRLQAHGCSQDRVGSGRNRVWRGIGVLADLKEDDADERTTADASFSNFPLRTLAMEKLPETPSAVVRLSAGADHELDDPVREPGQEG